MSAAPLLKIFKDGEMIKELPIEDEVLVGRGVDCVIKLDDRAVSREHAVFRAISGQVQIEKKSDFGPLSVNGAECTQALLKTGDVIEIGPYLLKLQSVQALTQTQPVFQAEPEVTAPPTVVEVPQPSTQDLLIDLDSKEATEIVSIEEPQPVAELQVTPADAMSELNFSLDQTPDAGVLNQSQPGEIQVPEQFRVETPDLQFNLAEDRTRVTSGNTLKAKLIVLKGALSGKEIAFDQDSVVIGRSKKADLSIDDKKASREHVSITRAGAQFRIKDLDSINGTYINGKKIKTADLSSGDVIRVGDVEIRFEAVSLDYINQEAMLPQVSDFKPEEPPALAVQPQPDFAALAEPIPQITGTPVGHVYVKKSSNSLLEKFKELPRRKQIIYAISFLVILWALFDEEPPSQKTSPQSEGTEKVATFESLNKEQRQFVMTQHDLAFELFKNKEYEKALFEVRKIFQLIPDYKQAREIERYAEEGKRKLEALKDEQKRKEEEARIQSRVTQLIEEVQPLMANKDYVRAKEIFSEILALDPENKQVAQWRQAIEDEIQKLRIEEQEKALRDKINAEGWRIYRQAETLSKKERYFSAIGTYKRIQSIGVTEKKLITSTRAAIKSNELMLREQVDPLVAEAQELEQGGNSARAFKIFEKAKSFEPTNIKAIDGMRRIRDLLHEKAKILYTEAVLAESYSDFTVAEQKFKEILDVVPQDDVYYDRAQRKLKRYIHLKEAQGQ